MAITTHPAKSEEQQALVSLFRQVRGHAEGRREVGSEFVLLVFGARTSLRARNGPYRKV
jgi:hypothetical protein